MAVFIDEFVPLNMCVLIYLMVLIEQMINGDIVVDNVHVKTSRLEEFSIKLVVCDLDNDKLAVDTLMAYVKYKPFSNWRCSLMRDMYTYNAIGKLIIVSKCCRRSKIFVCLHCITMVYVPRNRKTNRRLLVIFIFVTHQLCWA